jgi:hypothetical protein
MRHSWIAGLWLLVFPFSADASDFCADMFDGFAAEMNQIAASYDRMKTDQEVCDFGRNTDIPTHKRILAKAEANKSKCKNGSPAVNFARETLQKTITKTDQACRKAGM